MMIRAFSFAAAVAAVVLVAAGSAQAATICVNPNKASCQATIQDAVDAAVAGDTIKLSSGVYFENVTIPVGVDGLTITGKRSAILDPGDDGVSVAPNTGVGIRVESNDVTLRGFAIRSGDDDHIELADQVTGTIVRDIRSVNSESDFVSSDEDENHNTTISGCDIFAPDSSAADVDGNGVSFIGNVVRQTSSTGVDVVGNDVLVERNTFVGIENGDAIEITGNGVDVVRNDITGTDDAGVDVTGDDALVANNRLSGTYGGIEVSGQRPVVRNNRLTGTVGGGESIDVSCNTDCTGAMVFRNRTEDIGDDTESFDIFSDAAGLLVAKNVTRRGIDTGFSLNIQGATVKKNRVDRIGGDGEDCYDISGDGNTIHRNTAHFCMGSGFEISGAGNTLTANRAIHAGADGFRVTTGSTSTTLTRNRSDHHGLMGFRIQDGGTPATGTTLTNNRGTKSRYDLCDEGVGTTRSGNVFGSELAVVQDGVEDCPTF